MAGSLIMSEKAALNTPRYLILSICLMLAGCDEKFARLEFSNLSLYAGSASAPQIQQQLIQALNDKLASLDISDADIKVVPTEWAPQVIYLNIRNRSFSPEKREALRNYLQDIHDTRRSPVLFSWQLSEPISSPFLTIDPSSSKGRGSAVATVSNRGVEVSAITSHQQHEASDNKKYCYTTAYFDFPFQPYVDALSIDPDGLFSPEQISNSKVTIKAGIWEFESPAKVGVGDSHLVELLQKKRIQLRFEPSELPFSLKYIKPAGTAFAIQEAYIILNPALNQGLNEATRSSASESMDREACEQLAVSYGRPFTFTTGIQMDRLTDVRFFDR